MNCGSSGFDRILVGLFLASQPPTFDGGLGVCLRPIYENEVNQYSSCSIQTFLSREEEKEEQDLFNYSTTQLGFGPL